MNLLCFPRTFFYEFWNYIDMVVFLHIWLKLIREWRLWFMKDKWPSLKGLSVGFEYHCDDWDLTMGANRKIKMLTQNDD